MTHYTTGKKTAGLVIHQFFTVLMICGIYAMNYCMRNRIHEHMGKFSLITVIGLSGSFVALAYLTAVAGYKSTDDLTVHFHHVDKYYSDLFFVMFACMIFFVTILINQVRRLEFDFASLMITVGMFTYVIDAVFIIFYLSFIRRFKGNTLFVNSLSYKIYDIFYTMSQHSETGALTKKGKESKLIQQAIEKIAAGDMDVRLDIAEFHSHEREMAEAVNRIQDGLNQVVAENTRNERMKADLITNVSHDIKTPLTSIVNYVDLLKREDLDNERAKEYIRVLDEKAQRLKQLTEDLVEASKISSGNIKLDMQKIDWVELLYQTGGEFNERFEARNLTIVTKLPSNSIFVMADGRQLYRTIENLYTNAAKYAMANTRVYVELSEKDGVAKFEIKNVSAKHLVFDGNKTANDLTERFVRGEVSRTTEGSGLGLSIAKNLTKLMGGNFNITVDGDLFIATITFIMV